MHPKINTKTQLTNIHEYLDMYIKIDICTNKLLKTY